MHYKIESVLLGNDHKSLLNVLRHYHAAHKIQQALNSIACLPNNNTKPELLNTRIISTM